MLESLLNKVAGLKAEKKGLQHKCFPVNTAKSLRTSVLKNTCEWLLLCLSHPNQFKSSQR